MFESKLTKHKCECGELLYTSGGQMMDATSLYCKKCGATYTYWWRSQELTGEENVNRRCK